MFDMLSAKIHVRKLTELGNQNGERERERKIGG